MLTRRALISASALFLNERLATANKPGPRSGEPQKTTLVNLIGTLQSPYDHWWSKGGEMFATSAKLPYQVLECEGYFARKGLSRMAETISATKGNVVFNIAAPSEEKDLRDLVDLCTNSRVYFVTQDNIPPPGLRPWTLSPYYVAHIDFDETIAGMKTGKQLIAAMGGQGGILVLGGPPDRPSAIKRLAGLQLALSNAPHCYILDEPANAEWEVSASYDITRSLIAAHGSDNIGGVWAACDDMALGAVEALRLYKRPVPVTGMDGTKHAIDAIQNGTMTATVAWDSFWQGGIGLSLALYAKNGLLVPSAEPNAHRAFYGPCELITTESVLGFVEYRDSPNPLMDWSDFWRRSTGPIPDR